MKWRVQYRREYGGATLLFILFVGSVAVGSALREYPWLQDAVAMQLDCVHMERNKRTVCYEVEAPQLYPRLSIKQVQSVVRFVQRFDSAMNDCHFLAHRLGEVAVSTSPDLWAEVFAEEDYGGLCSFGFTHGVAIRAFKEPVSAAPNAEALEASKKKVRDICVVDSERPWREVCFHAMGHLLYFMGNQDARQAFRLCDELAPDRDGVLTPRTRCHTGVAMQMFVPEDYAIEPGVLPAPYEDLVRMRSAGERVCNLLSDDDHRGACMRGLWPLYADTILEGHGIDVFCARIEVGRQQDLCYGKLYTTLGWFYVNNLKELADACAALAEVSRQEGCFLGAGLEVFAEMGKTRKGAQYVMRLCSRGGAASARVCAGQIIGSLQVAPLFSGWTSPMFLGGDRP